MLARRHLAWGCGLLIGSLAGCARHTAEPVTAVAVAPAPAPPAAPVVAPHAATGAYNLTTTLKRTPPPPPSSQRTARSRRPARPAPEPTPLLQLDYQPVAAPDATAQSRTQLAATISLPGYTQAPRGRVGQAATWWPLPGDSVIVHFQTPRPGGVIDLRGTLKADTLAGEIWYTSLESGNGFQLGSFVAVKKRR